MSTTSEQLNAAVASLLENESFFNDYIESSDVTDVTTPEGTVIASLQKRDRLLSESGHTGRTDNPHSVTKTQVGLGDVDNTSDSNKPVSTAQQAAINTAVNGKADIGLGNVDNNSVTLAMLAAEVTALLGTGFDPALGQGDWNPGTNTPTIPAAGTAGRWYRVSVAGTASGTNADGTYEVNDVVVDNGSSWVLFRFPTANIADGYLTWAKFSDTLKKQVDKYTYNTKNEFTDPLFLFTGAERIYSDSAFGDVEEVNGVRCFKSELTATAKTPRFYIPVDDAKNYNISCIVQQKTGNQGTAANLRIQVFASATLGGSAITNGLGGATNQEVNLPTSDITEPTLYNIGNNLTLDASANYIAFGIRVETNAARAWLSHITINEFGTDADIYTDSQKLIADKFDSYSRYPGLAQAFGNGFLNLLPTDLTKGGAISSGSISDPGTWLFDTDAGAGYIAEKTGVQTVYIGNTNDRSVRALFSVDNSQSDLAYSFAIHKDSVIGSTSRFILNQYSSTSGATGQVATEEYTLKGAHTKEYKDYYIYEGTVSLHASANTALIYFQSLGSGNDLYISMASVNYGTALGWTPKKDMASEIAGFQDSIDVVTDQIEDYTAYPGLSDVFGKKYDNLLPSDLTDGAALPTGSVYQLNEWVLDTGAGSGAVVEKQGIQTVKIGGGGDKALRCVVPVDNSQTDLNYSFAIHKDSTVGASSQLIFAQYTSSLGAAGEITRETVTLLGNHTKELKDYYIYEGTVSLDSGASSILFYIKSVGSGNDLFITMASFGYGPTLGFTPKDVNKKRVEEIETTVSQLATDYLIPVDTPSGFDFTDYGFDILFDTEKRKFTTNLDPNDYKISGVDNTYHVSSISGDDSTGNGSPSNPYKSLWKAAAVSKAAGDTKATIYLEKGLYQKANGFNGTSINNTFPEMNIICVDDDEPAIVSQAVPASWSSTLTNTFVATFALGSGTYDKVVDLGQIDAGGIPKLLTSVASAAAVDALPGSYHMVVGGSEISVYVRLFDDATPTDSRVLVLDGSEFGDISGADRYLENVHFVGGVRALRCQGTVSHTVFFNRCRFHTSSGDNCLSVVSWGSGSLAILKDCGSFYGYNDNFNYHGSAGGKVVELDCYGHTSGLNSGLNSQNISTIHDGISIIRINPKFSNAQNRVVHDIGSGDSWNLGGVCGGTVTQSPDEDSVAWLCGADGGDTTRMWLDTCESRGGCAIDFGVHLGSTLNVRNCNISAYSGLITNGTIQRY